MSKLLLGFTAAALAAGVLSAGAPALAEENGPSIAAYSGPKPSGAIGTFGWFASGSYSSGGATTVGTAFLPGLAGNLWINPWMSVGAWATTGYFGGNLGGLVGPFTNADLELKAKVGQTGTHPFDVALTGDLGAELRSLGVGTGISPKVGAIFDMYLPNQFALQARLDWAPWLYLNSLQTSVFDYKLGIGHSLFQGLGIDVGLRGQTGLNPAEVVSLNGPYVGFGYVF